MRRSKNHRNTTRLTNKERADKITKALSRQIQQAMQAAVRQALARKVVRGT